jgi:hypothetical protein
VIGYFVWLPAFAVAGLIQLIPLLTLDKSVTVLVVALLAGFTDVRGTLHEMCGDIFKNTILRRGIKMSENERKRIVYRYNGDPVTDEITKDAQIVFPRSGEIVNRRGKDWKVVAANEDFNFAERTPDPILRVFLTDNF